MCFARDLLDLQAAALAAQFAGTNEYDVQGYATAIDWMRFNCHLTSTAAADLIAVGKNLIDCPRASRRSAMARSAMRM